MKASPPNDTIQIHLLASQGTQHTLKISNPSDAVWLLGIYIAADGKYQQELSTLKQQQHKYAQFLIHTVAG